MKHLVFMCVFYLAHAQNFYYDYYWRDYTGNVPYDAVPGGEDLNGQPTYIGQAFFPGHFLQVGRIYPGERELLASRGPVLKTKTYVKVLEILCSRNKGRFKWIPVNGKTLHVTTTNKHIVRGGTENDRFLNIGRLRYQGELIVGKVTAYNMGDAKLLFPYENAERNVQDFELLVYDVEPVGSSITNYSSPSSPQNGTAPELEGTILNGDLIK